MTSSIRIVRIRLVALIQGSAAGHEPERVRKTLRVRKANDS